MRPKINFTRKEHLGIISLIKKGLSAKKIAIKYGVGKNTIFRYLKEKNIFISRRTYKLDENYFEKIDSEEKAYYLGFLFADANISKVWYRLSVEIQKRDKGILDKFQKSIKSNYPYYIRDNKMRNYNWQDTYILTICSKKIVNDLFKLGCIPCKSLKLKFPNKNKLPKHLIQHFIRGYFDGDGSVSVYKKSQSLSMNILGTMNMLKAIQKEFQDNGINKNKILKKDSVYYLGHTGNNIVKKIHNYLYSNATVYLKRKKIIFEK